MGAYDLIYVTVGDQQLGARPTVWDGKDETGFGQTIEGQPVEAVEWITTCPGCADLVNVIKDKLYISSDDTKLCFKCPTCETGKKFKEFQFLDEEEKAKKAVEIVTAFIDPIKEGLFDHPIDHELLAKLDEESVKLF